MSAPRERWLDRDAGPVVRPYAMTKGRTVPASGSFVGLIDVVLAVGDPTAQVAQGVPADARLGREHRRLLSGCRQPITVVDLASDVDLPVGVVRVLLSDLSQYGMVRVVAASDGPAKNERLLKDVLDALQAF
jgi:Protein of unknown function (DUF742)